MIAITTCDLIGDLLSIVVIVPLDVVVAIDGGLLPLIFECPLVNALEACLFSDLSSLTTSPTGVLSCVAQLSPTLLTSLLQCSQL